MEKLLGDQVAFQLESKNAKFGFQQMNNSIYVKIVRTRHKR